MIARATVERLMLGLALLLALILRVYRLDTQSLWYDEAVTAVITAESLAELTRWTASDIQPPLYYYVVAGWTQAAGRGEWALRFPSVVFGTLAVPALWAVARRLFGRGRSGRIATHIVAWLAAISPLYVYFAQEARMYTLLTCLGVVAGYALLRARWEPRWWAGFVVAAVAALYTHYFAAFLLAAYAVCYLIATLTGDRHPWRALRWAAVSGAVTLLAYAPWLPSILDRYRDDRSYWSGALKVGEALRHVAISFTGGAPETMLESSAIRLLPWFGLVLVVALAALWSGRVDGAVSGRPRAVGGLLLACLVLPVVAILALASSSPKFNPRYLMMVSPAYLLLLAGGIGPLFGGRHSATAAHQSGTDVALTRPGIEASADMPVRGRDRLKAPFQRDPRALGPALGVLALAFLVGVSLLGLRGWFTDPAFTKAQWRELSVYLREQVTPGETVLLVSGHAAPAWHYYAPDLPPVRAPAIEVLDVEAVLDFTLGAQLGRELAGKTGVWLVGWQSDLVDPVSFVPFYLDRAGAEAAVDQRFWHLDLRHWRLSTGAAYPTEPQPEHPQAANYAHKVALLGWDDPRDGLITLYWQALNTLQADYQVSLVLENGAGQEVGRWDGRPAGYNYPTDRWVPGRPLFGRYPLPLLASEPDGDLYVTVALYDAAEPSGLDLRDIADNPAGKRVRLGPLRVQP